MHYLIKNHLGDYLVSDLKEQINEQNLIVLSWTDDNKQNVFEKFFSSINFNFDNVSKYINNDITKEEMLLDLLKDVDNNKNLVYLLFNLNIITEEEKYSLLGTIRKTKRQHLRLLNRVFDAVDKQNKKRK